MLETGEDGLAHFADWSGEKPADGRFLKTRYIGSRSDWNRGTQTRTYKGIRLDIPFDRYHMDEARAPRAERLTREASRSTNC